MAHPFIDPAPVILGKNAADLIRGFASHHSSISATIMPSSTTSVAPMAWFLLVLAGLFEIGWAIGLKYTEGFTRLWPTVGTIAAMIISLGLLGVAMQSLPVGTSYAVWVGVGAVGTAILGIVLLGEPANPGRLVSLGLIVGGIIGLKLSSGA